MLSYKYGLGFIGMEQKKNFFLEKKSKWLTQKICHFQLSQFSVFFHENFIDWSLGWMMWRAFMWLNLANLSKKKMVSTQLKLVHIYRIARIFLNFDDYPGFQHLPKHMQHSLSYITNSLCSLIWVSNLWSKFSLFIYIT